jgi:hypothetical protein
LLKIRIKKKLIENFEASKKTSVFTIKTKPLTFLQLAKEDENLQKRSEKVVGTFDQSKAGEIFIGLDPKTGKVIEHSGRARSLAASKQLETYEIKIRTTEEVTWDEIPDIITSEDGSKKFNKNEIFTLISATQKEEPKRSYKLILNGKLLTLSHNLINLRRIKDSLANKEIAKIKPGKDINSTNIEDYDILSAEEKESLINSL